MKVRTNAIDEKCRGQKGDLLPLYQPEKEERTKKRQHKKTDASVCTAAEYKIVYTCILYDSSTVSPTVTTVIIK